MGRFWRRSTDHGRRDDEEVIDLRTTPGLDGEPAPAPDPEVIARIRREADIRAARAELRARRQWHWSGEKVLQDGCRDREWWEDPFADPYAILDLLPGASWREISAARRRIARECHPDALVGKDDGELTEEQRIRRMAAANDAYERLRRAIKA